MADIITLDDAIGAVRLNCGDPQGTSHPGLAEGALVSHINSACSEVAMRTRILTNDKTFSAAVGTSEYDISETTYLDDIAVTWNSTQLERLGWQEFLQVYEQSVDGDGGSPSNGTPLYYSIERGSIWIHPPPDTAGTNNIILYYVADAAQLTQGSAEILYYGATTPSDYYPQYPFGEAALVGATARALRTIGRFREAREYREEFERLLMAIEEARGPLDREEVQVFHETE